MYYINNWVYTTNHKRIAVNYFWFVILSGIVGMVLATIIRLEFAYPGVGVFAGDSIQYLSLASAHGVIMVFFMIMPLLFGAFANFLLPTQLGVHDVAFPRLNSAAFWFLPGGLLMLCQLVCVDRRYQRMNCFNIREVQSLLKRKFFIDLLNTHDAHSLLNKTTIGLRYKLNNIETVNSNFFVFFNYGLHSSPIVRNQSFFFTTNTELRASPLLKLHFFFLIEKLMQFNILNLINSLFFIFLYYFDISVKLTYAGTSFVSSALTVFFQALPQFYSTCTSLAVTLCSIKIMDFWIKINQKVSLIVYYYYSLCKTILIRDVSNFITYFFSFRAETNASWAFAQFFRISDIAEYAQAYLLFLKYYILYSNNSTIENSNWLDHFFNLLSYINSFGTPTSSFFLAQSANVLINNSLLSAFLIETTKFWKLDFFFVTLWDKFINVNADNFFKQAFAPFNYSNNGQFKIILFSNYFNLDFVFTVLTEPFLVRVSHKTLESNTLLVTSSNSTNLFLNFNFLFFLCQNAVALLEIFWCFCFSYKIFFELLFFFFNFFFFNFFFFCINNNFLYYIDNFVNTGIVVIETFFFDIDFSLTLRETSHAMFTQFQSQIANTGWYDKFSFQLLIDLHFFLHYVCAICLINVYNICAQLLQFVTIVIFESQTHTFFNFFYFFFSISFLSNLFEKFTSIVAELNLAYKSNFVIQINESMQLNSNNQEIPMSGRTKRFDDIIFKYDYKAGDYFPKLNKEVYSFLFSSIINLTSGLRTSPWFFSQNFNDLVTTIWESSPYQKHSIFASPIHKAQVLPQNTLNKISNIAGFYNFFFTLTKTKDLNGQWLSFNSLNQKFYRMFITSSMQQRIYGNWRQLKFSREAWRCKLLSARHQKTLFKRYLHEDGVFWSIERNAKDLIPGWAMITPFSSRTRFTAIGKTDIGLMGVLLVLNSSIISGANFIVTYRYLSTLNNRKIRDARAFFTEAVLTASWMMILANPMLSIGIIMLLSDRHWQTSFFDYSGGGDTVLFQHMFWFFGHPEVYVIIIPTFGFTNTMLSFYLRKRISARASLLYSLYTIAFLGFFVWGHHMYMVGLAHTTRMLFSTLTVMISVPAATKIMHWCVTTVNSSFAMELPLLFTFTFIFLFVSGGISGMCVAHTGMDILFHDTFYVIGHFHVMLAGGAMFASFGAFYFYFPAIFGVKFSRIYAYLHYTYYLIGQLMTVIPMFWLGYAGMPRRVLDYPASFGGWHSVISAGHLLNVAGLMAFFIMIFDSLRQGRAATRNTFGINRYNIRLNFYIYEIAKLNFIDQKSLFLFSYVYTTTQALESVQNLNFESYETTLLSYSFTKN